MLKEKIYYYLNNIFYLYKNILYKNFLIKNYLKNFFILFTEKPFFKI